MKRAERSKSSAATDGRLTWQLPWMIAVVGGERDEVVIRIVMGKRSRLEMLIQAIDTHESVSDIEQSFV